MRRDALSRRVDALRRRAERAGWLDDRLADLAPVAARMAAEDDALIARYPDLAAEAMRLRAEQDNLAAARGLVTLPDLVRDPDWWALAQAWQDIVFQARDRANGWRLPLPGERR